jgi:GT2 family glycosyltransferase
MRVARGEWFILLNSDTLLFDESVARLFTRVRTDRTLGVAHVRLLNEDGSLQHSTYRFPSLSLAILEDMALYKFLSPAKRGDLLLAGYWDQSEERDVDWVSGAFMLLPRVVFERTAGFSEAYFMYGEDMEWGWRIREAGWRTRFFPQASITHLDHRSSAVRWGDRRIAICIERQLDIYERRYGLFWGLCFNAVRISGAAIRTVYFAIRGIGRGVNREYYHTMRRHSLLSLRTHILLMRHDDHRLSR